MSTAVRGEFYDKCRLLSRHCIDNIAFDLTYDVPMPSQPATPLLYVPTDVSQLSDGSSAQRTVLGSDVDACVKGCLDDIPLMFYPLDPWFAMETRDTCEAQQAVAKQRPSHPLPEGAGATPLSDDDLALIAESSADADAPLNHKLMPSLSLLKAPLYTELGTVAPELRSQMRLERDEREKKRTWRAATEAASKAAGGTVDPAALLSETRSAQAAAVPRLSGLQLPNAPHSGSATEYAKLVAISFRNAKFLDASFDKYCRDVATRVLGLAPALPSATSDLQYERDDASARALARRLLRLSASVVSHSSAALAGGGSGGDSEGQSDESLRRLWRHVWPVARAYLNGTDTTASATGGVLDEALGPAVRDDLASWLLSYAALLTAHGSEPLLRGVLPVGDAIAEPDVLKLLKTVHPSLGTATGRVSLRHPHPDKKDVVPLAVLPVEPILVSDGGKATTQFGFAEELCCRVFHGQRPLDHSVQAHGAAPATFLSDGQLYRRDDTRKGGDGSRGSDGDDAADAVGYTAVDTKFKSFKTDVHHEGRYLLVLRDHSVGYQRIGRLEEYHRDVSDAVETATRRRNDECMVLWEDGAPVTCGGGGRKRARA